MAARKPASRNIEQYFANMANVQAFNKATVIADNTTGDGTAVAAAAGFAVQEWRFGHTFIGGTDAVEPVTAWTPGYKFKILSVIAVVDVLLVGAAGSRVANVEIGTVNVTGGVVTIPVASAAVGTVIAGTAVTAANTGSATDTVSIEIAAGGTEFTAGRVQFIISVQNMDTADAYAALLAKLKTAALMATS